MAVDARFDRIQDIVPHGNADALEVAVVSNFPCVVRKGEFRKGEVVFYVRDDAKLDEACAWLEWTKALRRPGYFGPTDWSGWVHPWQEPLAKYLGGGGRVKTVKLRGVLSMGILLKASEACRGSCLSVDGGNMDEVNARIADPVSGERFLKETFGVSHWTAPVGSVGDLDILHPGLDFGLAPTDEENWENLSETDLHLGERCIVTRKLDGTSCTVVCQPSGEWSVASRNQTFDVRRMEERGESNIYVKFSKPAVEAGLAYAKATGKAIALRGEVCCPAVQRNGVNGDWRLNGFFLFGCEFPEEGNWFLKHGVYGTENHFLKVAERCRELGFPVQTVPVLFGGGERTVTQELLRSFNDAPAEEGEGCVVNVRCEDIGQVPLTAVWHYKSKSRDYLRRA